MRFERDEQTRKEEAETTIADFEEAQAEVNETIKEYEPKVAELKDQLAKHKSRIQAENVSGCHYSIILISLC